MERGQPPYEIYVLVCTNRRDDPTRQSCGSSGGMEIHQELKRLVKESGRNVRVRVSQTGCLDLCSRGPVVIVYPQGRLYTGVRFEDVHAILADCAADLPPLH